jgi:PIN domain-containing protein
MRSRPSSGRPRDLGPPEFLVDRSLSQVLLPAELREAGLIVHTLTEVYGEQVAQETEDTAWIVLAAQRGWVVLTKDDHIRRRPAERQAIEDGKVRAFCLTNAGLTFAEQASYFVGNRFRIIQASRKPGPYLYGVYKDRIRKLWPTES